MEIRTNFLLWISIFTNIYGQVNSDFTGVDIGHSCQYDTECTTGNGGEYSKCNQDLSICICTINHLGEDKCTKDSDVYHGISRRPAIYEKPGQCTLECSPKGSRKWLENEDWYGENREHFASFVHDTKTSACYDPRRAFNSVPDGFEIKQSIVPGAGLGTFTNVFVEQDTVFGPYKGIFEPDTDTAQISGYSWKIDPHAGDDRDNVVWVDAKDVALSNWIRYTNTPISASTENIVAFQYKGEMYYQAFKHIQPGTELFVWYGNSYGEFLEIEKFDPPSYYNAKAGYVGGPCYDDEEDLPCQYDENTICAGKTCFCVPGTHVRAGKCIIDETLGGLCTGSNGDTCKLDTNAECQRGVCVCRNNTTPAIGVCIPDEEFGGRCSGKNGEMCLLDNNTECVNGLCRCRYGATGINGKCMNDEEYQGRCNGGFGEECVNQKNTECIDRICVCKLNAASVNGKCELNEMVDGRCKQVDGNSCELDKNAECIKGFCICKAETSNINGICRTYEKLGGRCNSGDGVPCRIDSFAVCVQGICSCKEGESEVDGACISDGSLSGICIKGRCNDQNVVCDSRSNKCVCQLRHISFDGKCVKERDERHYK